MSESKRILFLHAHPDDIETLGAGTAALLAEAGHHIVLATMTGGDCGSRDHSPEEIAAIRKREAAAAANLLAAEYICLEFKDMAIFNDDPSRRRVTEAIRHLRPDAVITSAPVDYHCDHEATSVLVRDACFSAGAPNYRTGTARPITWIPHLYFMDPIEGMDRDGRFVQPDFLVDVGRHMETKRAMLGCHASQREWLRKHHGVDDYVENMAAWTSAQGERFGMKYAEGFRHYKQHPYPQTALLPELLSDHVVTPRDSGCSAGPYRVGP